MKRLKLLREREKLLQRDIAEYLNVSRTAYVRYENGEREPSMETLVKLAKYFKVSVDYIVENDNDEKKPATPKGNELDNVLISLIRQMNPDDYCMIKAILETPGGLQRAYDYLQGLKAAPKA